MSTIKIKKSSIQGRIPSTSDLDYGELAINIADGKLYFKTSSNEIQYFNASFADSSTVTGLIDSDYISNRQAPGLDSADVTNIVISNQNLAFKRFLVSGQFDVVADSSADAIEFAAGNNITLTTTPDDDTITFSTTALNESGVISLIDSSYVQARQASAGGGIDSAAVSALIDSDYVIARQLKSHSIGGKYRFDTSTTAGDPGSGDIRLSIDWTTGTQGSSYYAYVSETDKDGIGIAPLLDQLTVSTSTNKALVIIYKADAPTTNAKFYVTGQTDNGSYRTLDITYVDRDAWGAISNGDEIFMAISIIGDIGNGGIDSAAVSALIDSDYVSARAPSGTNSFGTVAVSGVGSFVADQLNDTVTFVGGTNVTLEADINTDTITINSTGGSGSGGSLDFGTIASPAGFTLDLGAI